MDKCAKCGHEDEHVFYCDSARNHPDHLGGCPVRARGEKCTKAKHICQHVIAVTRGFLWDTKTYCGCGW